MTTGPTPSPPRATSATTRTELATDLPGSERLEAESPSLARHSRFTESLYAEPDVARWHWPGNLGGPRNAAEARELLAISISRQERDGFSFWPWRERETGELVARVGLGPADVEGVPVVEVGWSVPAGQQGRGFATEAALASIEFGFDARGLQEIVAFTMLENDASRRVMDKCGMTYRRDFLRVGIPHALYAISRG